MIFICFADPTCKLAKCFPFCWWNSLSQSTASAVRSTLPGLYDDMEISRCGVYFIQKPTDEKTGCLELKSMQRYYMYCILPKTKLKYTCFG